MSPQKPTAPPGKPPDDDIGSTRPPPPPPPTAPTRPQQDTIPDLEPPAQSKPGPGKTPRNAPHKRRARGRGKTPPADFTIDVIKDKAGRKVTGAPADSIGNGFASCGYLAIQILC